MLTLNLVKDVSVQDSHGNTALHICCRSSCNAIKLEIVELLLHFNINIETRNFQGLHPLDMMDPFDPRAVEIYKARSYGDRRPQNNPSTSTRQASKHHDDEKPPHHLTNDEKQSSSCGSAEKVVRYNSAMPYQAVILLC